MNTSDGQATAGDSPPSALHIESIVQEVLRRLHTLRHAGTAEGLCPEDQPPATGELMLCQRVITWEHLQYRLEGVRRCVIPPQAVVTPTVRDELKRRGISLVIKDLGASASTSRLMLVDETLRVDMAMWQQRFRPPPLIERLTCRRQIINRLQEWVDQGGKGVWWTDRPASAVCRANAQGLPAYAVYDQRQCQDALEDAHVAVLVFDARRHTSQWTDWVNMLLHSSPRMRDSERT